MVYIFIGFLMQLFCQLLKEECWNIQVQTVDVPVVAVQSLSHVWICDRMDCSSSSFPVLHHFPEFALNLVHWAGDAIQPSHPLLPPSPPALKSFPASGVLSNELALCNKWPKYWSFSISPSSEYSGLTSFRMDWLALLAVQGTLKSSPTPQVKSINSSVLSFLYGPTLIPIHDYRENHSFD